MLRYPEPPVTSEGEAALVAGVLELDGDCLYVTDEEASLRFPGLWPYGTRWDPDGLAVVTPLGDVLAIGTAVEGGGGYWNADSVEQLVGPEAAELARRSPTASTARSRG